MRLAHVIALALVLACAGGAAQAAADPLFSPTSFWNTPVPAGAPVDPSSAAVVGNLINQTKTYGMGIATAKCGMPMYTVDSSQPTVTVTLDNTAAPLQAAWEAVPIPANAKPSNCSDLTMSVYQPSTDTMWEFWKMYMATDGSGWHAKWGGRLHDVSASPGYFQNLDDPFGNVLEKVNWGVTAVSFPLMGGVMMINELEAGSINHAISFAIPNACAGEWNWPAQRTDGNTTGDPTCVPEGAHFRLDPNLNLASLGLPSFTLMMAEAAQKYGLVVNDQAPAVTFHGEDPSQYIAQYGYNPYLGPQGHPGTAGALFNAYPNVLLAAFPWSHLQLLQMNLQTQPDTTTITING
jgi:hypothetical protein